MSELFQSFEGITDPAGAAVILGSRLKSVRLGQNMTRAALAQKANLSASTLQRIEQGTGGDIGALLACAIALGRLDDFTAVFERGLTKDDFARAMRAKTGRVRASGRRQARTGEKAE